MSKPSKTAPRRAAQGAGKGIPIEDARQAPQAPSPAEQAAPGPEAPGMSEAEAKAADEAAPAPGGRPADAASEAAGAVPAEEPKPQGDDQLAQAEAAAREWQDKYLRLHAEWDTYRRRTTEQREVEKARAAEKLVTSLLPVIDDFERTIGYAEKNGEGGLFDGVKAVHAKFVDVLRKDGVEVIDPAGSAFNALEAQAVATVADEGVLDETVAEVYQKGYKMGTKILRPAMVTVTTGGPKREKPQADDEN